MIYSIVMALLIVISIQKWRKKRAVKKLEIQQLQRLQNNWKTLEELERIPHY